MKSVREGRHPIQSFCDAVRSEGNDGSLGLFQRERKGKAAANLGRTLLPLAM